jgi:hypothetical protein
MPAKHSSSPKILLLRLKSATKPKRNISIYVYVEKTKLLVKLTGKTEKILLKQTHIQPNGSGFKSGIFGQATDMYSLITTVSIIGSFIPINVSNPTTIQIWVPKKYK